MAKQFDYADLEVEVAKLAKAAAKAIKANITKEKTAIVEIGKQLIAMKSKLGHGHFGRWLSAEFDMSVSTADRYMRVAETIGDKIISLTNLKRETIYALSASSTPDEVSEVVELVGDGKMSDADVRERIAAKKPTKPISEPKAQPPERSPAPVLPFGSKASNAPLVKGAGVFLYDNLKAANFKTFLSLMDGVDNNWLAVRAAAEKYSGVSTAPLAMVQ